LYTDSCVSWFESGSTSGLEYSGNGLVNNMPRTDKYVLSFVANYGWIKIQNPAKIPQALYVSYMTTGPDSRYPKTKVRIIETGRVKVLNTGVSGSFGEEHVHVQKVQFVGMVNPGESKVTFEVMERSVWPFRLTSVMVTTKFDMNTFRLPGGNQPI